MKIILLIQKLKGKRRKNKSLLMSLVNFFKEKIVMNSDFIQIELIYI